MLKAKYKTGQERFYHKYPQYPKQRIIEDEFLGVGAMIVPLERLSERGIDNEVE